MRNDFTATVNTPMMDNPSYSDSPHQESFEEAYRLLLRDHCAKGPEEIQRSAKRRTRTIEDMGVYLERCRMTGFKSVRSLPVIHVTGTKGKGSTSLFCERILRLVYGYNTGLFTSPHLLDVRERIRLNGRPVDRSEFASTYFELRRRLESFGSENEDENGEDTLPIFPGYFRMLTLMALYVFETHVFSPSSSHNASYSDSTTAATKNYDNENDDYQGQQRKQRPRRGVGVFVMEVGMGGRYDATNGVLLEKGYGRSCACGVTKIDLDHTRILGDTVEKIAWEKGGIFRFGRSEPLTAGGKLPRWCFALQTNTPGVLEILQDCAGAGTGTGTDDPPHPHRRLHVVGRQSLVPSDVTIGLIGDHQRDNAGLALELCHSVHEQFIDSYIRKENRPLHYDEERLECLRNALAKATWPGRCQTHQWHPRVWLHCDGAHTLESLEACLTWLGSVVPPFHDRKDSNDHNQCNHRVVLLFYCFHERDPMPLLRRLWSWSNTRTRPAVFAEVCFCRPDSERPSAEPRPSLIGSASAPPNATWQEQLAAAWTALGTGTNDAVVVTAGRSVREAMESVRARTLGQDDTGIAHICVTGSLYAVGSALRAAGWDEPSAPPSLDTD